MRAQVNASRAELERKLSDAISDCAAARTQQAATAQILRVIAAAPESPAGALETIARSAASLCHAYDAVIYLKRGDVLALGAHHGPIPLDFAEFPINPTWTAGRALLERHPIHVHDLQSETDEFPDGAEMALRLGHRTALSAPLLRKGEAIGTITLRRFEVRPFTESEISLLETFANEAVIAIENARLLAELEARNQATNEALERQTATADVLKVMSQSHSDLQPVLEAIAATSVRLCRADYVHIYTRAPDGNYYLVASKGVEEDYSRPLFGQPFGASRGSLAERAVLDRQTIHIPNILEDPDYTLRIGKQRSGLGVPLMRGEDVVGVIVLLRTIVDPFTDGQIELVTTFADQAVIAIENVRLFGELEARNRDLSEALERQTATAEVLSVISRSQSDLQPVLDTIVRTSARLCRAEWAVLYKLEGDGQYHPLARVGQDDRFLRFLADHPARPGRGTLTGRTALEGRTVHIVDVLEDPEYTFLEAQKIAGFRTILGVPLLRAGSVIGVIVVARNTVERFTDSEIALVTTFADQAVIAIENVRLFAELEARNRDLSEALEQQTATGEVLRVISSSPTDAKPVFDMIAECAAKLCAADFCHVFRLDGGLLDFVAHHGLAPEGIQSMRDHWPRKPDRGSAAGRAVHDGAIVQIADVETDPDYSLARVAKIVNFRSTAAVPMMREGSPIGAITISRARPGFFPHRQIDLLQTFADQAVIAIENVRLFDEVQARTRELTQSVEELRALDEVSQALSSILDLETVLATIVSRAVDLSGSSGGVVYELDESDQVFIARAAHRISEVHLQALQAAPIRMGEGAVGRAGLSRKPVEVTDIGGQSHLVAPQVRSILAREGMHSLLAIPLVREGRVLGGLVIVRREAGAFSNEVVGLLRTFAAHSVLAIQNARLFREIEEKGRELAEASRHKSQFLANMSHELRTPLNAILGYTELVLDGIYGEAPDKMQGVLKRVQSNGRHLLGLINDVLDLSKIEAGQLTLSLADYALTDILQSVRSVAEPLAAEKGLTFRVEVPPGAPVGRGDERRVAQVLLNLVGNAIKFTDTGEVAIEAHAADGTFRIAVRDTGPGIAVADQVKIFGEFQQADSSSTRKKGGTGLGLSISRRIVEMHGGRIDLESEPGQGATFTVTLPVTVERQVGPQ